MTLDDLAALEKQATPADWEYDSTPQCDEFLHHDGMRVIDDRQYPRRSDLDFIAAIRNAAPILIEVAKAAKGFRDHGEAKNGTHATILFEALARLEGVGK